MVTPRIEESHTVLSRLLQQFSQTPYACSSMSLPLNSRNGNFVYRGVLVQPILAQGDASSKRVIIKHVTNSVPKIFEELLLHTLIEFPPSTPTNAVTIKTPRLYLYDRGTNTQVLEDFPNTNDFKALFYIANAPEFFSSPSTASIGYHLGFWLPSFHEWASAPEQVALRGQAWQNDHMRKTKYSLTYDSISKVLGNYPELYEGHEKTLEIFRDAMAKEFERPYIGQGDDYGILHGDFWSGK